MSDGRDHLQTLIADALQEADRLGELHVGCHLSAAYDALNGVDDSRHAAPRPTFVALTPRPDQATRRPDRRRPRARPAQR